MELVTVKKRVLHFPLLRPSESSLISDTLDVTNTSTDYLAFKVKTTNQERYIVRPNVDTIAPGATVSIYIGVQPQTESPPPGPSKDKFLLRVVPCPGQPTISPNFWQDHENDPDVTGLKFKVEFDTAPSSSSPAPDSPLAGSPLPELSKPRVDFAPHVPPTDSFVTTGTVPPHTGSPVFASAIAAPARPHSRDLPPDLTGTATVSTASSSAAAPLPPAGELALPDAHTLLADGQYDEAMARVAKLQAQLDEKNLELARLKTELLETRAETERVLKDAPTTPFSANKFVSDPFGGASIAAVALMFVLFAVIANYLFRSR